MSEPTMKAPRTGWSDEQVENVVGLLLRLGVIISAAVAVLGGIPYLIGRHNETTHYAVFAGQPEHLTTVRGIFHGALTLNAESVVQLGLLLLLATPVARVALSLFAFAKQRDRTYVLVTTIVLAVLVWSLTGGGGM